MLYVSEVQSKTNLVIDVTSLENELRLNALSVSLYEDEIPVNRETEFRRTTAPEGIWTISRSYHDMHAGAYYLSVECGDVATSFRILPLLIRAQLVPGGAGVHGEICPGDWVYHVVDVSDYVPGGKLHNDVYHASLAFDVELHSGDFYYMLRPSTPPIRLVPPYRFAKLNATEGQHTFRACQLDIEHFFNERYYLALRGGEHCAEYAVRASIDDGMGKHRAGNGAELAPCTEQFTHGEKTMQKQTVTELVEGHFAYDSCEGQGLRLFSLYIPKGANDNYAFDVEDTTDGTDRPGGLFVMLARQVKDGEEEIEDEEVEGSPVKEAIAKQVTRIFDEVTFGINGVYRASLDAIKVETDTTYIVAVKCNDEPTRFRVSAGRTKLRLNLPDQVPGQLSAEQWSVHSVKMKQPSEYDGYSSAAPNLRLAITVHVLSGAIAVAMLREGAPPGLTTMRTNHYHQGVEELSSFTMYVCDPKPGVEYFVGFYGGELPADYEISTDTEFSAEQCTIPDGDHGYVWRYFKDPPKTTTWNTFFQFFTIILGLALVLYVIRCYIARHEYVKKKRKLEARRSNVKVHLETVDGESNLKKAHKPKGVVQSQSKPHGAADASLTSAYEHDVDRDGGDHQHHHEEEEDDSDDDDNEDDIILELDRRFGKGKGKYLLSYSKKMGLRRNRACQELQDRCDRKAAYKGLVVYLLVTVLFMVIIQLQRSIPRMNELESTMRDFINEASTKDGLTFEDMRSVDDAVDWLENGFIETFFPAERWYNGERIPEGERGFLRMYNKKLSGFMLKQKRVRVNTGDCEGSKRFSKFTPKCYPDSRDPGTSSKAPFGPSHDPTKYRYENFATGGAFAVSFPLDRKQALATLDELRRDLFIDKQTRRLELDLTVYNAAYRLFSIVVLKIDVRASGTLRTGIQFYTFPIEMYTTELDMFRAVLEMIFLLFVVSSVSNELFEMASLRWEHGRVFLETKWKEYLSDYGNVIDIVRLLLWEVSQLWFLRIITNEAALDLTLPLPEGQIRPGLYDVGVLWRVYSQLNATSVLVCLFTVFRFLNLSPQYGTLVRTITRAAPALAKFALMFCLIFGFFAVMGQLMFGTALAEWATIWSATQILFQMMTGEYGYEPLLKVDPYMAPVFYYSYLVLVFFLLLNILLAILMDTYAIITEELDKQEQRERLKHNHSIVLEMYYELVKVTSTVMRLVFNKQLFSTVYHYFAVPTYLSSEKGLSMITQEGNEKMISRSAKLKMTELDVDLEAVQDDDGLEDLLTFQLMSKHYSEISVILLLLSVGDKVQDIMAESAKVIENDANEKDIRRGATMAQRPSMMQRLRTMNRGGGGGEEAREAKELREKLRFTQQSPPAAEDDSPNTSLDVKSYQVVYYDHDVIGDTNVVGVAAAAGGKKKKKKDHREVRISGADNYV